MLIQGKQIAASTIEAANVDQAEIPTLAGTSAFTGTISVPLPTTGPQAANKTYVDSAAQAAITVQSKSNKDMAALATTADGQLATTAGIAGVPVGSGYVDVSINGITMNVGDGVKTTDCYFSNDGGTTARPIANIAMGDNLYWNGSIAGFQLATTDFVDFEYSVTGSGNPSGYLVNSLSGASVTPAADVTTAFDLVLTQATTVNAPTGMADGETIVIRIAQDGTGSHAVTFSGSYKWPSGIVPTVTQTASRVDLMTVVRIAGNFYSTIVQDVR